MTPSADQPGASRHPTEPPGPAALAAVAPRLAALAEANPLEEVCGLVEAGPDGAPAVHPLRNAAQDRTAAFALDPGDLLAALRRLERGGGALLAVFHSHPAGGPDLSPTDLAQALWEGEPLWPGVAQVVVALAGGRAEVVRAHRWEVDRYRPVDLWRRPWPEAAAEARGPGSSAP